ncbi:hypothetical protein LCGC14_1694120 [marine sediment metagenome]|uniref:ASCH domain-containing protein n=1 Tax=marine sediment metagenome TaxID=412755 RepID=A0A0F9KK14_9ZZZZ
MRIIGFSKKWEKFNNVEFTTFRFPRKDRDWSADEEVQVVLKPRSKEREPLGVARIIHKETLAIRDISKYEAVLDGFANCLDMWLWLGKPKQDKLINKLTLRWLF